MGSMDLILTSMLVRHLLGPPCKFVYAYDFIVFLGLIATPNGPIGSYNPSLACHLPIHLLLRAIRDITVVAIKLLKIKQC